MYKYNTTENVKENTIHGRISPDTKRYKFETWIIPHLKSPTTNTDITGEAALNV